MNVRYAAQEPRTDTSSRKVVPAKPVLVLMDGRWWPGRLDWWVMETDGWYGHADHEVLPGLSTCPSGPGGAGNPGRALAGRRRGPRPARSAAAELAVKHALAHPARGHRKVCAMVRHDGHVVSEATLSWPATPDPFALLCSRVSAASAAIRGR